MSIAKLIKGLFAGDRGAVPPARSRPAADPRQGAEQRHWITNPWHAVSIMPCKGACEAARQGVDERFLSKEAPPLPLAACGAASCQCRYRHHDDRRGELRRSADFMALSRDWAAKERRLSRGRRSSDLAV